MKLTVDRLKSEIIGENLFDTPYGKRVMTYADYTASGRGLKFIEEYMMKIEEMYANSHTEDSITGKVMTELLHKAEKRIKKSFNAEDYFVIPTGTGATGAITKLSEILGTYLAPHLKRKIEKHISGCKNVSTVEELFGNDRPVIFIGPYEHHSNDLIWRESIAEVVEIRLTDEGQIDLDDLRTKASDIKYSGRVKAGSFSASSNVTGVNSDIYEISRILHENDAFSFFDFAASGPYVDINMNKDDKSYFDAMFLAPHKFIGGPATSGLLLLNSKLYDKTLPPTVAGGGTVDYVSSYEYEFSEDVEAREKAGTPGILQVIKAALAIEIKEEIGIDNIIKIEHEYMEHVFNRLSKNEKIKVYGPVDASKRVSIMSFNIKHGDGFFNHRYIARLINDLFGIQSRAGCACAGPYGHKLLGIDKEMSENYRKVIMTGINSLKPGWVRVNFHYTMTIEEINFILDAIEFIADYGHLFLDDYAIDVRSGLWSHRVFEEKVDLLENFSVLEGLRLSEEKVEIVSIDKKKLYKEYMDSAKETAIKLESKFDNIYKEFDKEAERKLSWFKFKHTM